MRTDAGHHTHEEWLPRLRALADFLQTFEQPDFVFGEWSGGEQIDSNTMTMPYIALSSHAQAFVQVAYDSGWVRTDFDWIAWSGGSEFKRLMEVEGTIEATDPVSLSRLLTAHIRADRFSEGALSSAFRSGLLTRILRRCNVLLNEI